MKLLDNASIVYCDNHLLVAEKPGDIATQPDFTELAQAWVKKKYQKPGAVFLHPAHRLDKSVSGLVLFARTSKALSRLQEMMRERRIKKTYYALVEGKPPQNEGRLVHFLQHDSFRATIDTGGKEAILNYRFAGQKKGHVLLEIDLVTGRYHQIRVQLAAIGCPILGDRKYGSQKPWPHGIALHHAELRFEHPVTKEKMVFMRLPPFFAD